MTLLTDHSNTPSPDYSAATMVKQAFPHLTRVTSDAWDYDLQMSIPNATTALVRVMHHHLLSEQQSPEETMRSTGFLNLLMKETKGITGVYGNAGVQITTSLL